MCLASLIGVNKGAWTVHHTRTLLCSSLSTSPSQVLGDRGTANVAAMQTVLRRGWDQLAEKAKGMMANPLGMWVDAACLDPEPN